MALAALLAALPVVAPFGANLNVAVTDSLSTQFDGDTADRSADRTITLTQSDSNYQRNGFNTASFQYRITGHVGAEADLFDSFTSARLFGDVAFDFDLPTALWTIMISARYRGVQDSDSEANATAGTVVLSTSGAVPNPGFTLNPGSTTFFDQFGSNQRTNSTANGAGGVSIGIDAIAASVSTLGSNEAFVGFGEFASISSFTIDNALNQQNPFSDDGIFVSLEFRPSLDLTGQTLTGDLLLENGETLSGRGTVAGQIRGPGNSTIAPQTSGLTIGDGNDPFAIDFSGNVNVGSSTLVLRDATEAVLRNGTVTINGGTLSAGRILFLGSNVNASGTIDAGVSGNGTIKATGDLTIGDATDSSGYAFGGTLTVGDATVALLDQNRAALGTSTTLAGGLLRSATGYTLSAGRNIFGFGIIVGEILRASPQPLAIESPTGTVTHLAPLTLENTIANVYSQDAARFGRLNLIGATLDAPSGIVLDDGERILGFGRIAGSFSGGLGTQISAGGHLIIGDATAANGFRTDGRIDIGANVLTLEDADGAELGPLTTLAGGTLTAPSGIVLGPLGNITGFGLIVGANRCESGSARADRAVRRAREPGRQPHATVRADDEPRRAQERVARRRRGRRDGALRARRRPVRHRPGARRILGRRALYGPGTERLAPDRRCVELQRFPDRR